MWKFVVLLLLSGLANARPDDDFDFDDSSDHSFRPSQPIPNLPAAGHFRPYLPQGQTFARNRGRSLSSSSSFSHGRPINSGRSFTPSFSSNDRISSSSHGNPSLPSDVVPAYSFSYSLPTINYMPSPQAYKPLGTSFSSSPHASVPFSDDSREIQHSSFSSGNLHQGGVAGLGATTGTLSTQYNQPSRKNTPSSLSHVTPTPNYALPPTTPYVIPTTYAPPPTTPYVIPTTYAPPPTKPPLPPTTYAPPVSSYRPPSAGHSTDVFEFDIRSNEFDTSNEFNIPSNTFNPPSSSTSFGNPSTSYGTPSSSYSDPSTSIGAPSTSFGAPSTSYGAPSTSYGAPSTSFGAPITSFSAPSISHGTPSTSFGNPSTSFGSHSTSFRAPTSSFGTSSTSHGTPSPSFGTSSVNIGPHSQEFSSVPQGFVHSSHRQSPPVVSLSSLSRIPSSIETPFSNEFTSAEGFFRNDGPLDHVLSESSEVFSARHPPSLSTQPVIGIKGDSDEISFDHQVRTSAVGNVGVRNPFDDDLSSEPLRGLHPQVQQAVPSAVFSQPQRATQVLGVTVDSNEVFLSRDHSPNYSFNYGVASPAVLVSQGLHHSYQQKQPSFGHSEKRVGYRTEGRYYVDLPDGRRQLVSYYADETGYHPTITYV